MEKPQLNNEEVNMFDPIPVGAVALDDDELDLIVAGTFWRTLAAAATIGYATGRWLFCAAQCFIYGE
jgi:hypothetical protein